MAEGYSITVTVRPTAWGIYWDTVLVNARQFGLVGIGLFAIVVLFFATGFLFHLLNPQASAGWYHLLAKTKTLFLICSGPIFIVFIGSWVTTKKFYRDLSTMLGVTYRFSDAGVEIKLSADHPQLDLPGLLETRILREILQRHSFIALILGKCNDPWRNSSAGRSRYGHTEKQTELGETSGTTVRRCWMRGCV